MGYGQGHDDRQNESSMPDTSWIEGEGIGTLYAIGFIRSSIRSRAEAPKQGSEGAPDAWLEVHRFATPCLDGLTAGDEIVIVT